MQKPNKTTRYYTIQRRWRKCWNGLVPRKEIPEIRISGIWLIEEGFYPRQKIQIIINKNNLQITPYKPVA